MKASLRRPWRKRGPGPSRLGISLLVAAVCVFGYGIVQEGLEASWHDQQAARLLDEAYNLRARADEILNPAARRKYLDAASELSFQAHSELNSHWDRVARHAWVIVLGTMLSIAGVAVLFLHRRRTRNIV